MTTLADTMNATGAPRRRSWFQTFNQWGYFAMSHRAWTAARAGGDFGAVELLELEHGKQCTIMPAASQAVCNHSPDGFEMGYGGSGPAQLALAIMLRYFHGNKAAATSIYQDFKFEFVAVAKQEGFVVTEKAIDEWVAKTYRPSFVLELQRAKVGLK